MCAGVRSSRRTIFDNFTLHWWWHLLIRPSFRFFQNQSGQVSTHATRNCHCRIKCNKQRQYFWDLNQQKHFESLNLRSISSDWKWKRKITSAPSSLSSIPIESVAFCETTTFTQKQTTENKHQHFPRLMRKKCRLIRLATTTKQFDTLFDFWHKLT